MISKNQQKYIRQLEHKKYRVAEKAFVAEGPKVVGDLLACGFEPLLLIATEQWQSDGKAVSRVSEEDLRRVSFLQHPQQVLAVFPIPEPGIATLDNTKLYLALDDIQDPGNLGTIIRIADWFGIDTIYCSPNTADAWNPKVVQATMGSIARVSIVYTPLEQLFRQCHMPVYGTLLTGHDIYQTELTKNGIIVIGNEGNGISQPVRALLTHQLLIPSYHTGLYTSAESLNAAIATAITCAEFRRRQ
jgi:TrmH family RNA methyltransferase